MMLYPSMNDLLKKIGNRYLLVNIASKRARDIALDAEEREERLDEKPVKLALCDIMDGKIVPEESLEQ
ncbi:MAG: DNA-directed RNA polymerase subunit omega [Clostridia bacterium]|nr:DNA-directed RNA polymerase subunit omega [Clostridia bacterium]